MHEQKTIDFSRIAQYLQIRKVQVESVAQLLAEGNTVPFITRYRKERTGGLNEDVIRQIEMRLEQARVLAERKQTILKSIENQGKLTDELRSAIEAAETPKRLEDLYLPYKPKKRTLASDARDRGLEPPALAIWNRDPAVADLQAILPTLVDPDKGLHTVEDVRAGIQHIVAEKIAETAEIRHAVRLALWETGKLSAVKNENVPEGKGNEYKDYFQFAESARHIPPHRILAINRGEREHVLKVRLDSPPEAVRRAMANKLPLGDHPHGEFLQTVAEDALVRLLLPSLEREIRRELSDEAETHAVQVFARNLRSLLLQPPLHGRRVLAIDPGFRTGCKLAVLDEHGNLLEHTVIFPHAPQNKGAEAKRKLEELCRRHQVHIIAIGNGTACRETEEVVSELLTELEKRRTAPDTHDKPVETKAAAVTPDTAAIPTGSSSEPLTDQQSAATATATADPAPAVVAEAATPEAAVPVPPAEAATPAPSNGAAAAAEKPADLPDLSSLPEARTDLAYAIVNEAGASVYSASAIGREEFPDYDATLRGTISIGRRLQDPLSELVKIDPQNIGVGLYQHDVRPRHLKQSLEAVIESSVNHVGIDLNTASVPLLRHVSGLNQLVAREVVDYRKQHGPFQNRDQLLQVPGVGPTRYVQAAGFLRVWTSDNPFDRTWIHPESYEIAQRLLGDLGHAPAALIDKQQMEELRQKIIAVSPSELAARLQIGEPTLRDILEALARPGRDPRDDLPPPIFRKGILKLEDLQPGMELRGTVLNVVDFGAFVDIGLKDSGLVHISQMANRYVKNPHDVVSVGDVATVWVLQVDHERRRVSLTMIRPGTERKPEERKPKEERSAKSGGRPPRGRRQGPPPKHGAAPSPAAGATPTPAVVNRQPAPAGSTPVSASPPPRSAPPPRKHHRPPPRPKLSKAALEGDVPLRTFSELEAFFRAKDRDDKTPQPAAAEGDHGTPDKGGASS
jgi:transcriptional accessory protein Tex/SPT6